MTTLKDALGPMARPLAEVVANWRMRRSLPWLVRRLWPDFAKALDDLSQGLDNMIGPR